MMKNYSKTKAKLRPGEKRLGGNVDKKYHNNNIKEVKKLFAQEPPKKTKKK